METKSLRLEKIMNRQKEGNMHNWCPKEEKGDNLGRKYLEFLWVKESTV